MFLCCLSCLLWGRLAEWAEQRQEFSLTQRSSPSFFSVCSECDYSICPRSHGSVTETPTCSPSAYWRSPRIGESLPSTGRAQRTGSSRSGPRVCPTGVRSRFQWFKNHELESAMIRNFSEFLYHLINNAQKIGFSGPCLCRQGIGFSDCVTMKLISSTLNTC